MNIHVKTSIWEDAAFYEGLAARWRRSRVPGSAKYILFGILGSIVAVPRTPPSGLATCVDWSVLLGVYLNRLSSGRS